jgi:hypothetical protein
MTLSRNRHLFGIALLLLSISVFACAAGPRRHLSQAPATTESSAPAGPRVVKLTDAAAMKDLATDDRQPYLTDKIAPPNATRTIYFGELDTYDSDDDDAPSSAASFV